MVNVGDRGEAARMNKRGQSQGTIYQRRDGRWEGALTIPGTSGRRKRFYAATEEQAERQLAALVRAVAAGEAIAPESQTVGDYLAWWLVLQREVAGLYSCRRLDGCP